MAQRFRLQDGIYVTKPNSVGYDEHVYIRLRVTKLQYRLTLDKECRKLNAEKFHHDDFILDNTWVGAIFKRITGYSPYNGELYTTAPVNSKGQYYRCLSKSADDNEEHIEPLSDTEFRLWYYDFCHDLEYTDFKLAYCYEPQWSRVD